MMIMHYTTLVMMRKEDESDAMDISVYPIHSIHKGMTAANK